MAQTLKKRSDLKLIFFILTLFYAIFFPEKVHAQNQKDSTETKRFKLTVFPFAYYTPETSVAFGTMLIGLKKPAPDDSLSRNSNYSLSAAYTLKNQIVSDLQFIHLTKKERYRFTGNVTYRKFPMIYFGVGNDTPDDLQETVPRETFEFHLRAYRKVGPGLYAGLAGRFNVLYNTQTAENSIYAQEVKNSEGISEGVGFLFVYDKRDHLISAHSGFYLEVNTYFYRQFIGGKHQFAELFLDVRKYFKAGKSYVFAARVSARSIVGNAPFHLYPKIGGEFLMRGYYDGRFRDLNAVILQTEHRFQLHKKWQAVVFASAAQTASSGTNFALNRTKWAAGAGLRFAINAKGRIYIRLDFGFGSNSSGIYSGLNDVY